MSMLDCCPEEAGSSRGVGGRLMDGPEFGRAGVYVMLLEEVLECGEVPGGAGIEHCLLV